LTITGLRTVWELRGISCLSLEEVREDRKSIVCSRMFGRPVTEFKELREAVASYLSKACLKLRKQKSLAGYVQVFIETSRFKGDSYSKSLGLKITKPTANTSDLMNHAQMLLKNLFKEGHKYKKVGIVLLDISKQSDEQYHLLFKQYSEGKSQKLMQALDCYNMNTHKPKIQFASEGFKQNWSMKQEYKSKKYTTNMNELLEI